jgi:RNA polymerase sigma factor (TIGR02999 family)
MVNSESFELLFDKARRGDRVAREAVYQFAFYRLRLIASALLRREWAGHTLQPTALVSELFLRLHRLESHILSEDHFFRLSARAMKRVLIDHARAKKAKRKIPPELVAGLLPADSKESDPELFLTVRTVFDRLRALDPRAASTVWLRAVEGFTLDEVARSQSREVWRVRADYDFGVRWMAGRISDQT